MGRFPAAAFFPVEKDQVCAAFICFPDIFPVFEGKSPDDLARDLFFQLRNILFVFRTVQLYNIDRFLQTEEQER